MAERIGILVAGMHRSGTSALTRMLGALGCNLPRTLMAPDAHNENGYWESQRLADLNDEMLAAAGSSWDDWAPFDERWYASSAALGFRVRAAEMFAAEFGDAGLFVLKDPRVCRLLPFWGGVLAESDCEPRIVLPIRNPDEVAASLLQRDGIPVPMGHLIWLRNVLSAEHASRAYPRVFVRFADLLADWRAVAETVGAALEIPWPQSPDAVETQVGASLSAAARHHRHADDATFDNRTIPRWIRSTFEVLDGLARGGPQDVGLQDLDAIRDAFDEAGVAFAATKDVAATQEGRIRLLQRSAEDRGRQVEDLAVTVAAKDRQIESLDKAVGERDVRIDALNHELAGRDGHIQAVNNTVAERDGRIEDLGQQIAAGRAQIDSLQQAAEAAAAKDWQIESLDKAVGERDVRIDALNHEIAGRDGHIQAINNSVAERDARLDALTRRAADRDAELEAANAALAERDGRIEDLGQQIAAGREEIDSLQQAAAAAAAKDRQIESLDKAVGERDVRIDALNHEIAGRDGHIQAINNSVAERDARLDELNRGMAERDAELEATNGSLVERDSRIEALGRQVAALQGTIAERDQQTNNLVATVAAKDRQIESLDKAVAERDIRIDALNHEVSGRDGHIQAASKTITERDSRIAALNHDIADRNNAIRDLNRTVAERDGWVRGLEQQLAERDLKIDVLNESVAERSRRIGALDTEVAQRASAVERLEQALAEKGSEVDALNDHLAQSGARIDSLGQQVEDQERTVASLNRTLSERDERIEVLSEQAAERERRIGEREQTAAEREQTILDLNRQLAERTAEVEQSNGVATELQARVHALERSTSWRITAPLRGAKLGAVWLARALIAAVGAILYYPLRTLWRLVPIGTKRRERIRNAVLRRFGREIPAAPAPHYVASGRLDLADLNYEAANHDAPIPILFDPAYYLASNPDVEEAGAEPLDHYLEHGAVEGRMPIDMPAEDVDPAIDALHRLDLASDGASRFDPDFYRLLYPDLATLDDERADEHYKRHGREEARIGTMGDFVKGLCASPCEIPLDFKAAEYLDLYPDLSVFAERSPLEALRHYMQSGRTEPRLHTLRPDASPAIEPKAPLALELPSDIAAETPPLCVLAHVFYPELWDELAGYLANLPADAYHLYVNLVDTTFSQELLGRVRAAFPEARVYVSRNIGRDIGGHFQVLNNIRLADYRLFCLVHTKKSPHMSKGEVQLWRRKLLEPLLGTPERARDNIQAMLDDDGIGIIGAERCRYTELNDNAENYYALLDRLDIPKSKRDVEFLSGTMMLVRREVLERIYEASKELPVEAGDGLALEEHRDGQWAHSIERVFGNVARTMNYRIEWR